MFSFPLKLKSIRENRIQYFPHHFLYNFRMLSLMIYVLQGNFFASFLLGWSITTVSGVCAYPFDTLRRRMMLTSGYQNKYYSAMHAFREIVGQEGFSALFRGVTANMLLGMAGAGVLAGYDQLNRISSKHSHCNEINQGVLK
jgi:solute carrier family 25 (adenine nucleotide translocator) protein 4/5/6/31